MVSLEPTNASEQNLCKSSECLMESHGTPRSPNGCYAPTITAFMYSIPILNLFGRKLFEDIIQKPAQTGPAMSSPNGSGSRTVLANAVAFHDFTLAVLAELILRACSFWEISPPKKGPITFLAKGTLSGSLKSSEIFELQHRSQQNPVGAWPSSSDRKNDFF